MEWNAALAKNAFNAAINNSASVNDLTVYTTAAGLYFVVYHLFLQAEGAMDITLESGTAGDSATALTGPIEFAEDATKDWKNGGAPVFKGVATGDDFVLAFSAAVQVNGWALIGVTRQ